MSHLIRATGRFFGWLALVTSGFCAGIAGAERPNVILIVADDLGFTDLGCFGGEIATPNLDKMAYAGLRFTDFRAAPTCSPTRAMLMSGCDNHVAGLGMMLEQLQPSQEGKPGYETYLNDRVAALPEILRAAGYHTYMAGKWHLGLEESQSPAARGFEASFALLVGGASHFDISGTESSRPIAPYRENGQTVEQLPDDFYSTIFYTDKLIEYIDAHKDDGKPFFGWLAYTAPHWPLHAPDDFIDRYRGKYDAGFDQLRSQRVAKAIELGVVPRGFDDNTFYRVGNTWDQTNVGAKRDAARKMEIYAAMVECMDHHVGRLAAYLKRSGQFDNTYFIFMSDNGADGGDVSRAGSPFASYIAKSMDNSPANMGRKGSFLSKGSNWAQASMAPYKLWKGYTTDGGIRVPAFIYHPSMQHRGRVDNQFLTAMDVAPSVLELAGVPQPGNEFAGRKVVPMDGKSFAGLYDDADVDVHPADEAIGWEFGGRRAIFLGVWKAVLHGRPHGSNQWELYNLADDPAESNDLAADRPDVLKRLATAWDNYAKEKGVVLVDDLPPGRPQRGDGEQIAGNQRGRQGGAQANPARQPVVAALDVDGDREISLGELRNAPQALRTLDKNKDGQLTADEFRSPLAGQRGRGAGPPARVPGPRSEVRADGAAEHPHVVSDRKLLVDATSKAAAPDGLSWATAFRSLSDALAAANYGDQIWVAAGTYTPHEDDRAVSFSLKEGVALYGGFTGHEDSLDQRDWQQNVTILSGDIGVQGDDHDNSYHVVVGADNAVLDGFTVSDANGTNARGGGKRRGRGNRPAGGRQGQGRTGPRPGGPPAGGKGPGGGPPGPGAPEGGQQIHITPQVVLAGISPGAGAGMANFQCAPTVRNCIFRDNKARKGGAMYNMSATVPPSDANFQPSPTVTVINSQFINNFAVGRGGAISNDLGTDPTFIDCSFDGNVCDGKGGAVYNDFRCSPTFKNCLFVRNKAFNGGAIGNDGNSSPVITNGTFTLNIATDMGAALYQGTGPSNNPVVTNTIIWGNICENGPAGVVNWHDNLPEITFSCIEGGYPGEGNTEQDPRFVDPESGDFRLASGSPCIDAGSGLAALPEDRNGDKRFDDPGVANGPLASLVPTMTDLGLTTTASSAPVDIGAFERQAASVVERVPVIYVSPTRQNGLQDGRSWATAYTSLQTAIDVAYAARAEVWVAAGTYKPDSPSGRSATFQLREGVSLFGGFGGTERSKAERSVTKNVTTLSGNIGREDVHSDNCYHVLIGGDGAHLDSFRIVDGNADGMGYDAKGGGLINYPRHVQKAPTGKAMGFSVSVSNCTFANNRAREGGAVYNYDRSEIVLKNCAFLDNQAESGGAIVDRVGVQSQIENCKFVRNYAKWRGGAVYFDYGSRPVLQGCAFTNNRTDGHGGAGYVISRASQLENTVVKMADCTFTDNTAQMRGGALANADSGVIQAESCQFTSNRAERGGGAIAVNYMARVQGSGFIFRDNAAGSGEADIDADDSSYLTIK